MLYLFIIVTFFESSNTLYYTRTLKKFYSILYSSNCLSWIPTFVVLHVVCYFSTHNSSTFYFATLLTLLVTIENIYITFTS